MTDPKGWPTSQWLAIATLVVIFVVALGLRMFS
jgi:hypothetical protein